MDGRLVRQLLSSLFENAAQAMPVGGRLCIRVADLVGDGGGELSDGGEAVPVLLEGEGGVAPLELREPSRSFEEAADQAQHAPGGWRAGTVSVECPAGWRCR